MNADVKKLWVDALRSGAYKQGLGALRRDENYCCLGVLCDLHSKATGVQWTKPLDVSTYNYMTHDVVTPHAVMRWAGLESANPVVVAVVGNPEKRGAVAVEETLAKRNDMGDSFFRIADLIETNL